MYAIRSYYDTDGSTGGLGGAAGKDALAGNSNANRRCDPLVFDLDGDGLEFTNLADSQAKFDLTDNQFARLTAWVKGDDGS